MSWPGWAPLRAPSNVGWRRGAAEASLSQLAKANRDLNDALEGRLLNLREQFGAIAATPESEDLNRSLGALCVRRMAAENDIDAVVIARRLQECLQQADEIEAGLAQLSKEKPL